MLYLILLSLFATGHSLQCPDIEAVPFNDLMKHGVWYQQGRYSNSLEKLEKCVTFEIYPTSTGMTINYKDMLFESTFISEDSAIMNVLMSSIVEQTSLNITIKYFGFDDTYYAVYGCKKNENTNVLLEIVWIGTKTPQPLPETKAKINDLIASSKFLDPKRIIWIDHADCSY